MNAQNNTGLLGDSVHSLVVVRGSAVQNDVLARDCQSSLGALHIPALQDQVTAGSSGLLDQLRVDSGIGLLVGDENELNVHSLADTLVVNLLQVSQYLICILHGIGYRYCVQVLAYEGLLMTGKNSLATHLEIANLNGLHRRCSCLGELRDNVSSHVRALLDRKRTLSHLHAECHTGGNATFLTVGLRGHFKNI